VVKLFLSLFILSTLSFANDTPIAPDLSKIGETNLWKVLNGHARVANEDGRAVLYFDPIGGDKPGGSNIALALVQGVTFETGVIEVDFKGNSPPTASFLGIAFNVANNGADENHFEAIYFRPFNFKREGFTDHAVQYVAHPDHPWKELRENKPGVYEAKVAPAPDPSGWFHARIEITRERVSVTVNDGAKPCLTVDRLSAPGSGTVGLWIDSKPGAFSNLKITPAE